MLNTKTESYKQTMHDDDTITIRQIVFNTICSYPKGISDEQGSEVSGIKKNVYVARRNELLQEGLIINSDQVFNASTNRTVNTYVKNPSPGIIVSKYSEGLSFSEFNKVVKYVTILVNQGNAFQKNKIKELLK